MCRILFLLFVLVTGKTPAVAGQWSLHRTESTANTGYADAVQANDLGGEIKIFRRDDSHAILQFKISPRFSGLSRLSCPTFQIDQTTPPHHFAVGQSCHVESSNATYDLGRIHDDAESPKVVHVLMNGRELVFRYLAQDGMYHEMNFTLSLSKQTLSRALGVETTDTPN